MKDTVRRYYDYDEDGTIKLSVKTVAFGGYDRGETQQMVQNLSNYYKNRIMNLLDELAERDRELSELKKND